MMIRLRRAALVVGLSACLFVLNVWLPAQVVGHGKQHSHHSSATHADPLCTLMCSAGHVIHGVTLDLSCDGVPAGLVEPVVRSQRSASVPLHHPSRGPPSSRASIGT